MNNQTTLYPSFSLFDSLDKPSEKGKQPVLRLFTSPKEINIDGIIFGGWLMAQVDIAASIIARFFAKGRVVTRAINSFTFDKPINIGDILSFYGEVTHVGNTSLTINVEVYSQTFKKNDKATKVAEASLKFVAVDKDGKKRKLPIYTGK